MWLMLMLLLSRLAPLPSCQTLVLSTRQQSQPNRAMIA